MLVERWCAIAPVDATLWLLQQGPRLDTHVASEAGRILAGRDLYALGLLLNLAPLQWSREYLLAAAIPPLADRAPRAAERWFVELPTDAPYRTAALRAVAADLESRSSTPAIIESTPTKTK
jgi:hypothetical protein